MLGLYPLASRPLAANPVPAAVLPSFAAAGVAMAVSRRIFAIEVGGPEQLSVALAAAAVQVGPVLHRLQVATNSNEIEISLAG
jgi:hypothetical protein